MVDSDDESNALVVSLLLPGLAGSTVDDANGLCAVRPYLTPESSVLAPFVARLMDAWRPCHRLRGELRFERLSR